MEVDQRPIEKLPPPIEPFVIPTDTWKIELQNKLLEEKIQRIEADEKRKKEEIFQNASNFESEAKDLLVEISDYDPSDKWQYRKGLRLMYLGTKLSNEYYKEQGHKFFRMTCEKPTSG